MHPMLDNQSHARVAMGVLWINAGWNAAWLVDNVAGHPAVKNFTSAVLMIGLRAMIVLGAAITFFIWFYRAYKNLDLAGVNTLYAPGWAVGGFLVPLMNFIRPYRILEEIWRENAGLISASNTDGVQREEQPGILLKAWWACCVLSWLSLLAEARIFLLNPAAPAPEALAWLGSFFMLLAAILTIRVIKTVAAFEGIVLEKHRMSELLQVD